MEKYNEDKFKIFLKILIILLLVLWFIFQIENYKLNVKNNISLNEITYLLEQNLQK